MKIKTTLDRKTGLYTVTGSESVKNAYRIHVQSLPVPKEELDATCESIFNQVVAQRPTRQRPA